MSLNSVATHLSRNKAVWGSHSQRDCPDLVKILQAPSHGCAARRGLRDHMSHGHNSLYETYIVALQ